MDKASPRDPSHCVGVTGYIYRNGRFLLLKRKTPPMVWAPPGGRLFPNEDPLEGVRREIREETSLQVRVLSLVNYWFGELPGVGPFLSLDFLTTSSEGDVVLSTEHEDFCWATLEDLEHGKPPLGHESFSYRLDDFQEAHSVWRRLEENG